MSIPPLLITRYRNGSAQVGRLLGGVTFAQIGTNLPAGAETSSYTETWSNARAVQFGNTLFAYQANKIYRFDGNDWVVVHTTTSPFASDNFAWHSGLHLVQISGVLTLVAVYVNTANVLNATHSTDGVTWTDYTTTLTTSTTENIGRSIVFRNDIYISINSQTFSSISKYDTSSNTATELSVDAGWSIGFAKDLCVFNGELYGIGAQSTNANDPMHFKKLVGSQFVNVLTFSTAHRTNTESDHGSAHLLFTDGVKMYAFMPGVNAGGAIGTTAAELTPNGSGGFTSVDITTTVIPVGFRPVGPPGTRWWSFMDNDTDPGNPTIYIWSQTPNGDSAYNAWKWNGPSAAMTNLGVGPASGIALPHTKDGGGEYIFTLNEPSIEIVNIEPSLNSQIVSYIVYGDEFTGGIKIRLWFDDEEIFARVSGTLLSATGGGTIGADSVGDYVDDVVGDGITVHTVEWDVIADGLARGDTAVVMLAIDA